MLPPLRRVGHSRALGLAVAFVVGLVPALLLASPQEAGRALEAAIGAVLRGHGFAILRDGVAGPRAPDRLAWRDVGYTTTDGDQGRVDFVLRTSAFARPVWVAAVRRPLRGSSGERLTDLLRDATKAVPDVRVVLVLDGDDWRREALAWARTLAARVRARPVHVMTLAGFRDWLGRRLEGDEAPFGADAPAGSGYLADTVRE